MNLELFSANDPEKDQIRKLKSLAGDLEHKFQNQPYNITPELLQEILGALQKLSTLTKRHTLLNKISDLIVTIAAAIRYYLDNKYEEFYRRVGVIIDKLKDLDE